MLSRTHARKRPVPPVRLSLRQFADFCEKTLGNLRPAPRYSVTFEGSDGSEIAVSDVRALIGNQDEVIPDVIVMPTVQAESASGDSIALRVETVGSGNSQTTSYVLSVKGSSQVWADGVVQATIQWFDRKRTFLFRYYRWVMFAVLIALFGCVIFAAFYHVPIVDDPRRQLPLRQIWGYHWPARLIALVAAVFLAFMSLRFTKVYPPFSVVIREHPQRIDLFRAAAVLGSLGALATIWQVVAGVIGGASKSH